MTPDLSIPVVREVELHEFMDLLTSRRTLERFWPFGAREPGLRGALRDPLTGTLYTVRRGSPSPRPAGTRRDPSAGR